MIGVFGLFLPGLVGLSDTGVVGVDPGFSVAVVDVGETGVFGYRVTYLGPGVGFFVLSVDNGSVYPGSFSLLSGQAATVYVTRAEGVPGVYDSVLTVRELGSGETVNVTARLVVASECIRGSTTGGRLVLVADSINVSVEVNATGQTCARLCVLPENPLPEYVPQGSVSLDRYFDIRVGRPDHVSWPITVKMNYSEQEVVGEGLNELSLGLSYWNGTGMESFNDTGVDTGIHQVYAFPEENETGGSIVMAIASLDVTPIPEPPATSIILVASITGLLALFYWRKPL